MQNKHFPTKRESRNLPFNLTFINLVTGVLPPLIRSLEGVFAVVLVLVLVLALRQVRWLRPLVRNLRSTRTADAQATVAGVAHDWTAVAATATTTTIKSQSTQVVWSGIRIPATYSSTFQFEIRRVLCLFFFSNLDIRMKY
eukprot:scaffold123407_cov37-Attheya_sp.AAC.3